MLILVFLGDSVTKILFTVTVFWCPINENVCAYNFYILNIIYTNCEYSISISIHWDRPPDLLQNQNIKEIAFFHLRLVTNVAEKMQWKTKLKFHSVATMLSRARRSVLSAVYGAIERVLSILFVNYVVATERNFTCFSLTLFR